MARVILEKVSKSFRGPKGESIRALEDVSFAVEEKELLVLVGPSGCGKTTTLRLIAGLEEMTSGTISIDGRVVNEVPPKDRDIAMVFQNPALYPHMTVLENLTFGLKVRKLSGGEIEQRVREASEMLDLGACLLRRPEELSGGQRQRVALARAIVLKPRVLLFDEPLSNLDLQMRAQLRTEIGKLHARLGTTMIYVTHDQVEAMTLGDRIVVMRDGKVQQVAEPLQLYREPANLFVAGFIGSPPMNFLRGSIVREGSAVFLEQSAEEIGAGNSPLKIALDQDSAAAMRDRAGAKVILGLRPEDISISASSGNGAIEVVVEMVEQLGSETHVHLRRGNQIFVVRRAPSVTHKINERLTLSFNLSKARFFDADSGHAIS